MLKKSGIQETLNLSTDVDSRTHTILRGYMICQKKTKKNIFWGGRGVELNFLFGSPKKLERIMWPEGQWEALKKTAPNGAEPQMNGRT